MNDAVPLVDFAPALRLALLALLIALLPLGYVWLRQRGRDTRARLAALTAVTLFLTFDLIVFGAFTRLSDSGLGCPDWPGCYGAASPIGAAPQISAEQAVAPSGKVTFGKAWIEMIHRYLAMTVGVLVLVMTVVAWRERARLPFSPWWPTATLVWTIVQGLFGKYTVTLKLYPAVVTLHLVGGLVLLALLALQHAAFSRRSDTAVALVGSLRTAARLALAVLAVQIVLGGWVSTNYAVLACTGFPQCNGQWWPAMSSAGFAPLRELGHAADGSGLGFDAMVGIHMAHRLFGVIAALVLGALAWRLARAGGRARRYGAALAALLALQLGSGLSNVVLGWPLIAALLHSAGAAAMVLVLTLLLARARQQVQAALGAGDAAHAMTVATAGRAAQARGTAGGGTLAA
jgi:cytochrome c oxidase assembly protein subunit 15